MKYRVRRGDQLNKEELQELKNMSTSLDKEMQNLYVKSGLPPEDNSWTPPTDQRTIVFPIVEEKTIGFLEYSAARNRVDDEFFFSQVYIKPEHRREGYAKSLLIETIRHIKEVTGLKNILILGSIVSGNTASQKLFDSMGRIVYSDNFYFKA